MPDDQTALIDVVYKMSIPELRRASLLAFAKRLFPVYIVNVLLTVAVFAYIQDPTIEMFMVVDWIFLIAFPFLRFQYHMGSPKIKARLEKPARLLFDRDSLRIFIDGEQRSLLKLSEIERIHHTGGFWMLYVTRTQNYVIPDRVFTNEQQQTLAQIFRENHLLR